MQLTVKKTRQLSIRPQVPMSKVVRSNPNVRFIDSYTVRGEIGLNSKIEEIPVIKPAIAPCRVPIFR